MIEVKFAGNKKVDAHVDGMVIKTDQSVAAGGEGSAPDPFTYFLASLATCAGIFVKGFCDKSDIDTEGIRIFQTWDRNPETRMIENLTIDIKLPANFPDKYKSAVISSANLCAVKRHLQNPPNMEVITSLAE